MKTKNVLSAKKRTSGKPQGEHAVCPNPEYFPTAQTPVGLIGAFGSAAQYMPLGHNMHADWPVRF